MGAVSDLDPRLTFVESARSAQLERRAVQGHSKFE